MTDVADHESRSGLESTAAVRSAPRAFDTVVLSVSLIGLSALMLRVALHAMQPLSNPDTWFHLRIGHELLGPWSLTRPGSLTRFATEPWVPTQWSTEIVMAKFEDWFGLPGVAWLSCAFYLSFVLAVYLVARQVSDPLVSAVVTGLVMIGAADVLSARPQVLSLVLFAASVAIWRRATVTLRPPWLLVPLTWVWATIHGLWSAGVVLGVVMAAGIVLDHRTRGRTSPMLAVPASQVLVACLTPVGPSLLNAQLRVSARASMIGEWAPTSFRTPSAFAVAVMAGVLILVWRGRRPVRWTSVLVLLTACGWAMLVTRMVAFSAVLLAPLLAEALATLKPPRARTVGQRRAETLAIAAATLGLLVLTALVAPRTASAPGDVPSGFAPRLAALQPNSAVLVEDPVGSWIEWRFPKLNPTFDGMLDAYRVDYLHRFVAAHDVSQGWQRYVGSTGARVAVTVKGSPLTAAMTSHLHWRQVQTDKQWVYLVAPDAPQA